MSLEISEDHRAFLDRLNIVVYLSEQRGAETSNRFLGAVSRSYSLLSDMPGIGAPRYYNNPQFQGMRVLSPPDFRNYLIYYQATEKELIIRRILHGSQDSEWIFEENDGFG